MSEGRRLSSHSCCGIDTIPNTYEDTGMKRALIIFVISIAYAGLAFADERVDGWLKRMDRNGDGVLVPDETTGLMKRHFARNDANGDGKLDKSELTALSKRLQQRGIAPNNQNKKRQDRPGIIGNNAVGKGLHNRQCKIGPQGKHQTKEAGNSQGNCDRHTTA